MKLDFGQARPAMKLLGRDAVIPPRPGRGDDGAGRRPPDARKAVLAAAAAEAWRRGDRRLGTDHLLLGLLRAGDPVIARAIGVSLDDARSAASDLDRAALAAVGVQAGGLPAAGLPEPPGGTRLPPLTSAARAVLKRAADKARTGPLPGLQQRHVLLAVLGLEPPDPAAQLLAALGVQAWEARNRMIGGR
jgi:Clp amino terminal domain, pathogenicity island component